jgi:hypothetical protein
LPSFYWHLSQPFLFTLSKIAMKKARVKGEKPVPENAAQALGPAKGDRARAALGKGEGQDSAGLAGRWVLAGRWDRWLVR